MCVAHLSAVCKLSHCSMLQGAGHRSLKFTARKSGWITYYGGAPDNQDCNVPEWGLRQVCLATPWLCCSLTCVTVKHCSQRTCASCVQHALITAMHQKTLDTSSNLHALPPAHKGVADRLALCVASHTLRAPVALGCFPGRGTPTSTQAPFTLITRCTRTWAARAAGRV